MTMRWPWSAEESPAAAQEFGNFSSIKDNYPKIVISRDKVTLAENGIIHRSIIDFLLDR